MIANSTARKVRTARDFGVSFNGTGYFIKDFRVLKMMIFFKAVLVALPTPSVECILRSLNV